MACIYYGLLHSLGILSAISAVPFYKGILRHVASCAATEHGDVHALYAPSKNQYVYIIILL